MSSSTRTIVATWALAASIGMASRPEPIAESWRHLLEATVYLVLVLVISRHQEIRKLFASLPGTSQVGISILLAALMTVQLYGRDAKTYPLVFWDMYTDRDSGEPWFHDFSGRTRDGRELEINFARDYRGLSRKILFGLKDLKEELDEVPDGAPRAALESEYEDTLRSLGAIYNRDHSDDPIASLRLWQTTIPTSPFRGFEFAERSLEREVEIR